GPDGMIHVWDLTSGKDAVPPGGHQGHIARVSASADGKTVVTASKDETIRVWDPATGAEKRTIAAGGPVIDCRRDPGGTALIPAVGPGRSLRKWDTATGADVTPAWFPEAGSVSGFRFTPDGRTLLTHADNHLAAWRWPAGMKLWATETPAVDNGVIHVNSIAV